MFSCHILCGLVFLSKPCKIYFGIIWIYSLHLEVFYIYKSRQALLECPGCANKIKLQKIPAKKVQYWLLNLKLQIKGHFVSVLLTFYVVNEQDHLNSIEKNTSLVYKAHFLGNVVNEKC